MVQNFSEEHKWLLNKGFFNRLKIGKQKYHRLNTPGELRFSESKIRTLKNECNAKEENGGLILFKPIFVEGKYIFEAVDVRPITNVSPNKNKSYEPDEAEWIK